jgi:hypothetical protein
LPRPHPPILGVLPPPPPPLYHHHHHHHHTPLSRHTIHHNLLCSTPPPTPLSPRRPGPRRRPFLPLRPLRTASAPQRVDVTLSRYVKSRCSILHDPLRQG